MNYQTLNISNTAARQTGPQTSRASSGPAAADRPGALQGKTDDRLKKACSDFEGLFLNMMVQTMKKTIPEGGVLGKSHQSEVFDSMFLQEISTKLAKERGLGIGDALYRQVRRQIMEKEGK
jgi:peptidoglycan hydrolase FlgJ